jgi:hypothetical protein
MTTVFSFLFERKSYRVTTLIPKKNEEDTIT